MLKDRRTARGLGSERVSEPAGTRSQGLAYLLVATAVAGIVGYGIQLLAPALLGPLDYVTFSVFWSAAHLGVAALGGIQQELTRATQPARDDDVARSRLRSFALGCAAVVVPAVLLFSVFAASGIFASAPTELGLWLMVGALGSLATALLNGLLYGLSLWPFVAWLTIVDICLRGFLVVGAMLLGLPATMMAAAVAIPFGIAAAMIWLASRARVTRRYTIDAAPTRLALNSVGTVIAALATGVIVTGLPVLLRTAITDLDAAELGGRIAVITITRAPLIIPILGLASFLIVAFRAGRTWPTLVKYGSIVLAVSCAASVLAYVIGPASIALISGGKYQIGPLLSSAVVLSAGLVALLGITGPALVASSRQLVHACGWVTAAISTAVLLHVPVGPDERIILALLVAPIAGLAVHLLGLRGAGGASAASAPETIVADDL